MKAQLKTLFASFLLLIAMCFGAFASVGEKHSLGDFSSTQRYVGQNPEAIQLVSLGNFTSSVKSTAECCNATNRTFDFTISGSGNDLRRFTTLDGTDVRINSGHAYNRTHAGGDVSQIGTMDEIENAILRDISANSRLGSLQPRTTQTHTVQVNGQTVGYSLADTPVGVNLNYYPAID